MHIQYLLAQALPALAGSEKPLLNGTLGGCHVVTVRDGDVHGAAVGVCHRAGPEGKRFHWVTVAEAPTVFRLQLLVAQTIVRFMAFEL